VTDLPRNFLALILLISVFLSTLLVGCSQVETFEQEIQVQAADTGAPVSGAAVRAEVGVRDAFEAASDSDGVARLEIESQYLNGWAKVIVEADGYKRQSFLVKLGEEDQLAVVKLASPGGETAVQQPADQESAPAEETAAEMSSHADETAAEMVEPAAETDPESVSEEDKTTTDETATTGVVANLPPAVRADYYQAKPELTIDIGRVYRAIIQTSKGDIVVSLDATAAPEHVNNFIFLSNEGFYNGLNFHRVEPGFVIQGGDPLGSGQGGPGYTVPGEFSLKHVEGALAMARRGDEVNPNRESSGSQFYITLAPTEFLDGQYSVFGQVEAGMDVVRSIQIGDTILRIIVEP
jgi:cyclophilin family peptidyl-prolyl cis-trans isomerase